MLRSSVDVAEASPERSRDVAERPRTSPGRLRDVPAGTFIFSAPESVPNNRFAINTVVSFGIFLRFVHSPPRGITRTLKGRPRDVARPSPGRSRTSPGRRRTSPRRRGVPGTFPGRRRDVAERPRTSPGRLRDVPAGTFIFSAPESVPNNRFAINTVVSFGIFLRFVHSPPRGITRTLKGRPRDVARPSSGAAR